MTSGIRARLSNQESEIIVEDAQRKTRRRSAREPSRDVMATLDSRLEKLVTKVDEIQQSIEEITDDDDGLEARMVTSLNKVLGDQERRFAAVEARVEALQKVIQELQGQLAWEPALERLRRDLMARIEMCEVAAATGGQQGRPTGRVDAPKPKMFDGSRSARDIDNFLYHMERYFDATLILDDASKLRTVPLFLGDVATLWWRRVCEDIARERRAAVTTWRDFKAELKRQFYPEHATDEARRQLRRLKQSGTVREYVKSFTELMFEIPDMADQNTLFTHIRGWPSQLGTIGNQEAGRADPSRCHPRGGGLGGVQGYWAKQEEYVQENERRQRWGSEIQHQR